MLGKIDAEYHQSFVLPRTSQIIDGEEFSKMLRLWTNGYDVYTPSRSYIGHDYRHRDPKVKGNTL